MCSNPYSFSHIRLFNYPKCNISGNDNFLSKIVVSFWSAQEDLNPYFRNRNPMFYPVRLWADVKLRIIIPPKFKKVKRILHFRCVFHIHINNENAKGYASMPQGEEKRTVKLPHNICMEERAKLMISGVREVDSFDDRSVILLTEMGELHIKGTSLHISNLDVDTGELTVTGKIIGLVYQENSNGSFFSKLFK